MARALGSASAKLRSAAPAAAFASVYFVTAVITGSLAGDAGVAVLWPVSGIYLGVMLRAPHRMWPALACAAGGGSLAAYLHGGSSFEVSLAFAVPSSAEGLLGALLVERIARKRFTFRGLHDLFALVLGGAAVANALVGLSAAAVAAQTFDASFAESWLRWWSADALGVIAVAPIITAPARAELPWPSRWWSRQRLAGIGALGSALVAMYLVSRGGHAGGQVYLVQAFLAVLLLSLLAFAAAASERERLREALSRTREGSEDELDRARRQIAHLTADLAARRAELFQAGNGRERVADDLRRSESTRASAEQELADARSALTVAGRELDELGRDLGRTVADRDRVQSELAASADEVERLQGEIAGAVDELARTRTAERMLQKELERTRTEGRALQQELERAHAETGALAEELEGAARERARSAEELAEAISGRRSAEDDFARACERVGALEQGLERSRRAHEDAELALEHARERFTERRAHLERSLDEVTKKLAQAQSERSRDAHHATEPSSRYDERGTCLSASPAFATLLGYAPHELVGRLGAELLHPDDRFRLARARANRSRSRFEARLRRKAGDFVWVEVSLDPVWSSDQRLVELKTTVRRLASQRAAA